MVTRTTSQDAVVIGGGQAGLTLSFYLQQLQVQHVVFERDRPFSAWRNRWEGFRANSPSWMNTLPMLGADRALGRDPNAFATKQELVDYLDACLANFTPPLQVGVDVESVAQRDDGIWEVVTANMVVETPNVAVCIGSMSAPRFPAAATELPDSVPQLHSLQYRDTQQISTDRVLVVGSGSSGIQITELLAKSGRFSSIHLAQSKVLILPRSILGVPIHRFVHFFGLFDVRVDSLLGRFMFSNLETRGDPIIRPTPKELSRDWGVQLHDRYVGASKDSVRFADGDTIATEELTVIWCTGLRGDYSFVKVRDRAASFDVAGNPLHRRGIVPGAPGLSFVGLRYQHTVASHDIYGIPTDARHVAEHIADRLGKARD